VEVPNTVSCCRRSLGFDRWYGSAVLWLSRLDALAVARSATEAAEDRVSNDCYLVDPASSHMLVSKIKPCMSQYLL
jgi:hypothetical protein